MQYEELIRKKAAYGSFDGIRGYIPRWYLFPHQQDLTQWALKKGRSAVFADTGLGKTAIELEWAYAVTRHNKNNRVLILAPLAVAEQIVREGIKFGVDVKYLREDDGTTPIIVTNYEILNHFDASLFAGVVLDESSILKNFTGKIRDELIQTFKDTPYRLACTATPAPNDFTELGNHSEFLGVKTRTEMLAEYFVHDGETTQEWRLKGHAEIAFWEWVCTWGAVVKSPADLGHDGSAFVLPKLNMNEIVIQTAKDRHFEKGELFAKDVTSLSDQRTERRLTRSERINHAVELCRGKGSVIVWGELNDECDLAESSIEGARQVKGSHIPEQKRQLLDDFSQGKFRVLVSKPSICGFGMNWQHCHTMIFLGATHSYEMVYQAVRRCWRFGQKNQVDVYVLRADTEGAIIANYRRKESDAARLTEKMSGRIRDILQREVKGHTIREWNDYNPSIEMTIPSWARSEA